MNKKLFYDLTQCPKECVYALVNEADKRIQVYSTGNFLSHFSKLIQELGTLDHKPLVADLEKIELVFLETRFENRKHRDVKFKYQVDKYRNLGYNMYVDLSLTNYRIRECYKHRDGKSYVVLELRGSKGVKPILIGVFSKYKKAKAFLEEHYKDGIVTDVVKASTEETKLFEESYEK